MSQLIPQQTIDTLRQYSTVAVSLVGIDCELFIPKPTDMKLQEIDWYDETPGPENSAFDYYKTKVSIEWSPNIYMLRKLGIYAENDLPIIAWFSSEQVICRKSWFRIGIEHIPRDKFQTNEFEIVDQLVKGVHDAIVLNCWRVAPLRRARQPASESTGHV